ncbi:MAG: hypothetical protein IT288_18410 [Bdellovibrionales bacterium]|nr:hypothetical protein [Bdellovibrionales bacterium]
MAQNKLEWQSHVYEISERLDQLNLKIRSTTSELIKIFPNGHSELMPQDPNVRAAILRKLESSQMLSKRELRYFWRRTFDFEQRHLRSVVNDQNWTVQDVEKNLIRGWDPVQLGERVNRYLIFEDLLPPPKILKRWSDLGDLSQLLDALPIEGCSVGRAIEERPQFLRRTNLFKFIIAAHCYYRVPYNDISNFDRELDETGFGVLTYGQLTKLDVLPVSGYYMIAALLKGFKEGSSLGTWQMAQLEAFRSVLGDPRGIGSRWEGVQKIEQGGFETWLGTLNEEDIKFFFDNLGNVIHPERREFWLRYRRRARRVVVVLDGENKSRLRARFSTDPKTTTIVNRAYQFNYGEWSRSDQQLLIFFIKDWVFVEGSASGFACRVFKESVFRERFKIFFNRANNEPSGAVGHGYEEFRSRRSGSEAKWIHRQGWERNFERDLQGLGIYKDSYDDISTSRLAQPTTSGSATKPHPSPSVVRQPSDQDGRDSQAVMAKILDNFLKEVEELGGIFIDQRPRGRLWIIHDRELVEAVRQLKKFGIHFEFQVRGGPEVDGRAAWYLKK